jgi:hypothetical protein
LSFEFPVVLNTHGPPSSPYVEIGLIDFFIAMSDLLPNPTKPSPPPPISGDHTFFTLFPREIRDEIYSHVLSDAPLTITNPTLPFLTEQLPPCLQANQQMIQEAISAHLRRTTLIFAYPAMLQRLMAGLPSSAWQSIRYLAIEDTAQSAEDVQNILTQCPGLRHLGIGVPASMVVPIGRSSAAGKPFGSLAHMFEHKNLRELSLECFNGRAHYALDQCVGLRDAFQAWAQTFVDEGRKKEKEIDVRVKIIPYKGFVHPKYEFGYYTEGRVTSYQYWDCFG